MRSQLTIANTHLIEQTIKAVPEVLEVCQLSESFAAADADTISAILNEAAKFAADVLTPLNDIGDREGAQIVNQRVVTPEQTKVFWQGIIENGWLTLDAPEVYGGQGLPLFLALSVQEIFDRSCAAASMLPTPNRSAVKLLAAFGNEFLKEVWIPKLVSGEHTASICISEVGAGSDVNRIRTKATHVVDGVWCIEGEKHWISFGDHDLTEEIGHCLLARAEGDKGLSLFFVPRLWEGKENHIHVRRIEEKLGIHLSPTCALGFEGAKGWLLGERERGLPQMFVMITNMRLSVGVQGLALASAAADMALSYAKERRQGGRGATPMPIIEHVDVQRQLMEMISDVETLRGLAISLACHIDIANSSDDNTIRAHSSGLVGWIMPAFKTMGGEIAFETASKAVQVLGGAGYTREWPVEQYLRDARVLPVFEGTTGIQALDLLHRRLWRGDKGAGLTSFLEVARGDANQLGGTLGDEALKCYRTLEETAAEVTALIETPHAGEAGATALLSLAGLAARCWSATRLANLSGEESSSQRIKLASEYFLSKVDLRSLALRAEINTDQKNAKVLPAVNMF